MIKDVRAEKRPPVTDVDLHEVTRQPEPPAAAWTASTSYLELKTSWNELTEPDASEHSVISSFIGLFSDLPRLVHEIILHISVTADLVTRVVCATSCLQCR